MTERWFPLIVARVSTGVLIGVIVGAVICGSGILMAFIVFFKKDVASLRPRAATGKTNFWDVLLRVVDTIAKFTPPRYRFPVVLMMLGIVVLLGSLVVGASSGGLK